MSYSSQFLTKQKQIQVWQLQYLSGIYEYNHVIIIIIIIIIIKSCELDPFQALNRMSRFTSLTDLFNSSLASSHNASNQLLSHLISKTGVLITMI